MSRLVQFLAYVRTDTFVKSRQIAEVQNDVHIPSTKTPNLVDGLTKRPKSAILVSSIWNTGSAKPCSFLFTQSKTGGREEPLIRHRCRLGYGSLRTDVVSYPIRPLCGPLSDFSTSSL